MNRRLPGRGCVRDARTIWWAACALADVRRQLGAGRTESIVLTPPPTCATRPRGLGLVFRMGRATCLEASLVRQHWLAAHGVSCDVVIGVTAQSRGFEAHAWLERSGRNEATTARRWRELTRLPAPAPASAR